jgi:hypothetical protein
LPLRTGLGGLPEQLLRGRGQLRFQMAEVFRRTGHEAFERLFVGGTQLRRGHAQPPCARF